jgi:Ca-activated chloride channel family protein
MTSTGLMTSMESSRPAGLVSVDGRTYPLKSARLEARAEGGVAVTTLIQTYGNPYEEPLEVLYTLPLPASGAVIGYAMRLGNRIIRGEVRKREEAQEEYRKALLEGRAASLLEQDRADTFAQKLGCLPPGQSADIEIEVLQPLLFLPADGKEAPAWEYRFPTVAGVRYEGAPGRVPDAEKLDVDRPGSEGTPVRLEASLLIADGPGEIIRPCAPWQKVDVENDGGGARVALREGMKLDRDLVVRWSAVQAEVGVRFLEGRGLPCDDGRYALITITPPATVAKGLARDLTILIDASGSMSGKPLERAKIVTEELLRSLDPGDRFEILAFANSVQRLAPGPVEAEEKNLSQALAALKRLDADGSTEMTQAIVAALAPLRGDSQRQVILISDGYIGFESEVIGEIMRRLVSSARLHTVGIGSAPNRTLTRGAARAGRGIEILVGDDDDARAASRHLLLATVRPVLTDIEVKGEALIAMAPARPKDVLAGQPIIVTAEISAAGGRVDICGKLAGRHDPWVHTLEIPGTQQARESSFPATTLPVGALFGREAIEDAELRLAAAGAGGEAAACEAGIEKLGLRHGIASRQTSLIAISEDPAVDPKNPRRREHLAVELPAEVSAEGVGLVSRTIPCASMPTLMARMAGPRIGAHRMMEAEMPFEANLMPADESAEYELSRSGEYSAGYHWEGVRTSGWLEIFGARVLLLEGPRILFEFEAPAEGFTLPYDGANVNVSFSDGLMCGATMDCRESSSHGPHHAGLTVRMALRLEDQYSWHHYEAQITWYAPETGQVNLHISLGY